MCRLYRSILEIAEVASGNHLIVIDQFASLDIRRQPDSFIDWTEISVAIIQELLKTVDYIVRAHDALKIEADPIGRVAFEREEAFGGGRHNPGAEDAQSGLRSDQSEFDRVPVEPRQMWQLAKLYRSLSTLAVSLHEIRVDRVCQQRHVAENIVEDVRFLKIIHLLLGPNEGSRGEAFVGEVIEEDIVGHEPGDRDDTPTGDLFEPFAQLFHMGNARVRQLKRTHHRDELVARAVA